MSLARGQFLFEPLEGVIVGQGEALRDIEHLVVASSNGDKQAFGRLVVRFQKRIFYAILKVVRDTHLADDLTQEVFIKAFCSLHKLRTPSLFSTWIHRIALNKAIDCHRKRKKENEKIFFVDDFFRVAEGTQQEGEGSRGNLKLLRNKLEEGIDALPEGQRVVVYMTMNQGLAQEEISRILGIPVGTVKSRLHHARKFLSVKLRDYL